MNEKINPVVAVLGGAESVENRKAALAALSDGFLSPRFRAENLSGEDLKKCGKLFLSAIGFCGSRSFFLAGGRKIVFNSPLFHKTNSVFCRPRLRKLCKTENGRKRAPKTFRERSGFRWKTVCFLPPRGKRGCGKVV